MSVCVAGAMCEEHDGRVVMRQLRAIVAVVRARTVDVYVPRRTCAVYATQPGTAVHSHSLLASSCLCLSI